MLTTYMETVACQLEAIFSVFQEANNTYCNRMLKCGRYLDDFFQKESISKHRNYWTKQIKGRMELIVGRPVNVNRVVATAVACSLLEVNPPDDVPYSSLQALSILVRRTTNGSGEWKLVDNVDQVKARELAQRICRNEVSVATAKEMASRIRWGKKGKPVSIPNKKKAAAFETVIDAARAATAKDLADICFQMVCSNQDPVGSWNRLVELVRKNPNSLKPKKRELVEV